MGCGICEECADGLIVQLHSRRKWAMVCFNSSKKFCFPASSLQKSELFFFFCAGGHSISAWTWNFGEMKQQCSPSHYRFQLSFLLLWMRFSMSPSMKWHCAPPLSSSLILAYQFLTFCLVSISALEVLTIAIHLPLFSFGNRYLHSWRMREGSRDTKRHERKQCACCLDIYTTHLVVFFISPVLTIDSATTVFLSSFFILNPKSPQNMYM